MNCPFCMHVGIKSRMGVDDTRPHASLPRVVRRRSCSASPALHVLETVEHAEVVSLDRAIVLRSGDREDVPYDRRRLRQDIQDGVLKLLTSSEVEAVTDEVESDLRDSLNSSMGWPGADADGLETVRSPLLNDLQIRDAVERRLRIGKSRVAHVLYALSVRGRVDVPDRTGFRDAEAFLGWMYGEGGYDDLRQPIPPTPRRSETRWFPPTVPAPEPASVIKREGGTRKFGRHQFTESIRKAMFGRHEHERVSSLVAEHVLWSLSGQEVVLSSQLASATLAGLRRTDDIAYLRYSAIAKGFTSVRQFVSEAHGLLTLPSDRLVFDVAGMPRMLPPEPRHGGQDVTP